MKIIGCVLFISLTLFSANTLVYIHEGNIFYDNFTEPIELLYIVFYDGHLIRFTTFNSNSIHMYYSTFKDTIEKRGRKIKNIAIAIHNHLPGHGMNFSSRDILFFRQMRRDGFKGSFCLFTMGKRIRCKDAESL